MSRKDRRAGVQGGDSSDLFAEATAHYRNGALAPAQSLCRAILARDPRHVGSLVLSGDIAQQQGRNNQAVKLLEQALAIDPTHVNAHDSIAMAYQALGQRNKAIRHYTLAVALGLRTPELLVRQSAAVLPCLNRLAKAGSRQLRLAELFGGEDVGAIAEDALVLAVLQSKAVLDLELERFLTAARRALLQRVGESEPYAAGPDALRFFCALAQQCFFNEYVFAFDDEERTQSQSIHDRIAEALKAGAEIAPLDLVVAAAYRPLHTLQLARLLLNREWPDDIARLLAQQVREPLEEISDQPDIPTLTPVDDALSLQVQDQYEENPYPRWSVEPPVVPTTLETFLRDRIGVTSLQGPINANGIDILIAGCGTGSHPIDSARRFSNVRVLALDLSRASLAYARRKTRELGLRNIEYGQADILRLDTLERRFDVIETVGVLHHLGDPEAGWRVLLSLLRPNGLMFVGLYSALARRAVTAARAYIAERGFRANAEDIRICRQEMIRRGQVPPMGDFSSMSGCRDLLFNVMEHQFTIPRIKAFLDANNLAFLGFGQVQPQVLREFKACYSGAEHLANLASWHAFEQTHPHAFSNMYFLWVQKREAV
jgi:2-polyprenyl-3-methyl-5-hydroxy-6-metoxy-1,4-benzoquinol methylase